MPCRLTEGTLLSDGISIKSQLIPRNGCLCGPLSFGCEDGLPVSSGGKVKGGGNNLQFKESIQHLIYFNPDFIAKAAIFRSELHGELQ